MASSTADEEFRDIRPYRDEECLDVLARLSTNDELLGYLSGFAFPHLSRLAPSVAVWLCHRIINYKLHKVHNIASFQVHITGWFFFRMLRHTSNGIKIHLATPFTDQGQILFSNHRDISVDPAVICYSLYLEGQKICMIGIGDNLLSNEYATDIMRLNRSFIVKRSFAKDVRRMYAEMHRLSSFIYTAVWEKESIWLAQREGRAKDSIDRTSQAVLKMLKLSAEKGTNIAAALNRLNIRPVSISYEYDPCDVYKARAVSEGLKKKEEDNETTDLKELTEGITGYKGCINVSIGDTMQWDETRDLNDITAELDRAIIDNYQLYGSHFYALRLLMEKGAVPQERLDAAIEAFKPRQPLTCSYLEKRIAQQVLPQWLDAYLRIYANPVLEKLKMYETR